MALKYVGLTIFCIVFGFIHMANGRYVIISPDTIRPGLPLVLCMNIETEESFTIAASIINTATPNALPSVNQTYFGSTVDTIELQVPDGASASGTYKLQVLGTGGVTFNEEKTLKFVSKGFSIYIQTDKAIYKPGQTIKYRIFAINPDLSQRMVNYDIEIKDPLGNLIQQWTDYQAPSTGVVVEELLMSTQPVLGDWSINATSGDVSAYQLFTIEEYVLPKFEVSVTLPSFITSEDTILEGRVDAIYTYGKPVKGTVLVKIITGSHEIELNMVIDGSKSFSVPIDDLMEISDGVNFNVIAIVNETLTGNLLKSTASIGYFNRPVKVDILEGNSKTFKPSFLYTAYIAVTRQDGTPLSEEERSVPLLVSYRDRHDDERKVEEYYEIPSNGVVTAQIDAGTLENKTSIDIQARYYTMEEESEYVDSFRIDAMESPSNSFIQIILANSGLNAGEDATFNITSTEVPHNIVYMILSKGNIVLTGTLTGLTSTQNTLNVAITADMVPSAKLIAYYVRSDNETVVDVYNFNVDGSFENKVSLSFSSDVVEPGDNINVDIAATGGSLVYLLAVDQSVLLLKSGNDITQKKVIEELETFDSSKSGKIGIPRFYPFSTEGIYAANIFKNSGVIVLTDAKIPDELNNILHISLHSSLIISHSAFAQRPMIDFELTELTELTDEMLLTTIADSDVRAEFPETWLWMETTVGDDGMVSIETTVPDTITSWVGSAFALSTSTGFGVVPTTSMVTVFKPFFVSMNLPYSVIRGENLALEILVFNYQTMDITADVKLHKSDDFHNIEFNSDNNSIDDKVTEVYVSKDQVVKTKIPAGEGVPVSFAISPKNLKLMDIHVTAQSTNGRDSVIRQLLVEPEGVTEFYTYADLIDLTETNGHFTKSFFIDLPPNGVID
ncbi:CD109 antigen-like [Antedon mediterranea]|uniref:CD109 antigen-like n=1 Tax=Antedon mediterranea TaxID=105859 RepID=UPI003AF6AB5A